MPLISREKVVIRNFFLLREVFIFASKKGVIFLDKCIGGLQFCNDPFVLYASIGDTLPAILAGLLMEYKMAMYSTKIIRPPQMRRFLHDHPSALRIPFSVPTPRAGFTGRPGWNCRWKSFPGWDGSICRMVSGMENASSPEAGQKPPSARGSTPGKGRATAISSGLASGTSRSAANGARNASSIPAASSSSAGKGRCRRRPGSLNGQCGSWSPMGVTAEKL